MTKVERAIGIVLGILLGLAIVIVFVFVFSEDTVDAPSLNERAPIERPLERQEGR